MDPVGALGMLLSSYNNSTVKLPADISKKGGIPNNFDDSLHLSRFSDIIFHIIV